MEAVAQVATLCPKLSLSVFLFLIDTLKQSAGVIPLPVSVMLQ